MPAEDMLRRMLDAAFGDATGARLDADGARLELDRRELAELRALLDPGREVRWLRDDEPIVLRIQLPGAPIEALYLHRDASVRAADSTGARVADPQALAAWLHERIEMGPIARCPIGHARLRGRWLRAAPPALRPELEDIAWCGASPAVASQRIDSATLLAWHGSIAGPWNALPPCMRALHGLTETVPVERLVANYADDASLRGLARLIAERVRSRATAELVRAALARPTLDAVAALAQAEADGEARERVMLAASGALPPASLGVARHGRFQRLHSDGRHAVAYDGASLRWFGADTGEAPAFGLNPIAAWRGEVLVARGRILRIDMRTGATAVARRSRLRRWLAARRASRAAWLEETRALCRRHGVERGIVAEPSENDFDAHAAFAHLGVPEPPALGLAHVYVATGDEVHALPRRADGTPKSWRFDEPVLALAADREEVHVLTDACWWTVDAESHRLRAAVAPLAGVRGIRPREAGLLVHGEDALGDWLTSIDADPRSR